MHNHKVERGGGVGLYLSGCRGPRGPPVLPRCSPCSPCVCAAACETLKAAAACRREGEEPRGKRRFYTTPLPPLRREERGDTQLGGEERGDTQLGGEERGNTQLGGEERGNTQLGGEERGHTQEEERREETLS